MVRRRAGDGAADGRRGRGDQREHEGALSDDLRVKFLAAFFDGQGADHWVQVWRVLIEHPWYQRELDDRARWVLQHTGCPRQWLEDIKHDAVLLLGRTLRQRPDLHVDTKNIEEQFAPWMRQIITRDWREAVRRMRCWHDRSMPLACDPISVRPHETIEQRVELSLAIDRLPDPERTVLTLRVKGWTVEEIAAAIHLHARATYRVLRRGTRRLNVLLADKPVANGRVRSSG